MEAQQYKAMGVPKEKIAIIPNGIDLSEYADLPPEGIFKKKFNMDENEKIVLYLGRIHRIKVLTFLLRLLQMLLRSWVMLGLWLLVLKTNISANLKY